MSAVLAHHGGGKPPPEKAGIAEPIASISPSTRETGALGLAPDEVETGEEIAEDEKVRCSRSSRYRRSIFLGMYTVIQVTIIAILKMAGCGLGRSTDGRMKKKCEGRRKH